MPKKGYKMSEEHKRKIGEANKISKLGIQPSDETRKRMSISQKNRTDTRGGWHHTEEAKKKIGESEIGEKHPLWKEKGYSYNAVHHWIQRWKGKAKQCEICGVKGKKRYHWANKDHKYRRVLEDYIAMCVSCHRLYDNEKFGQGRAGSNQYVKR